MKKVGRASEFDLSRSVKYLDFSLKLVIKRDRLIPLLFYFVLRFYTFWNWRLFIWPWIGFLLFTNDPSIGRTNNSRNKREIWWLVRVEFFIEYGRVIAFLEFFLEEVFNWTLIACSFRCHFFSPSLGSTKMVTTIVC